MENVKCIPHTCSKDSLAKASVISVLFFSCHPHPDFLLRCNFGEDEGCVDYSTLSKVGKRCRSLSTKLAARGDMCDPGNTVIPCGPSNNGNRPRVG